MNRYLVYSATLHAATMAGIVLLTTRVQEPKAYYGFQFLGGQSGFGPGRLEPAPTPLVTRAQGSVVPPAQTPETPPAPSDDPGRIAIPDKPEAPEKPYVSAKQGGVKGGRGESPLGRGDIQGSKTQAVGGVGTSLEIGGFGPGGGGNVRPFPYKWYGELIYKRLWEAWDRTDAGTRECKVAFTVRRDGSVKDVKIKISSGDSLFDMGAKRAVSVAGPFPPLPDGFKEDKLPVLVRFRLQ